MTIEACVCCNTAMIAIEPTRSPTRAATLTTHHIRPSASTRSIRVETNSLDDFPGNSQT